MREGTQFVLLIDDDVDDQSIFQEAFLQANSGLDLFMIVDATKAIQYLKTSSILPSLIILDYNMPILNGAEVIQAIKQQVPLQHIPIVMLSTSTIGNEECLKYGAIDCFVKPDNFSDLIAIIKKALQHRLKSQSQVNPAL